MKRHLLLKFQTVVSSDGQPGRSVKLCSDCDNTQQACDTTCHTAVSAVLVHWKSGQPIFSATSAGTCIHLLYRSNFLNKNCLSENFEHVL